MFRFVVLSALVVVAFGAPQKIMPMSLVPQLDGRVVGGEAVDIKDYPHQISLLWHGSHVCGGSIVSEKYVITAAHCTAGDTAADLSIRAGSSIRNSGGVVVQVAKLHQNPKYNSGLTDYDISVLELSSALSFGAGIGAVDLPKLNQVVPAGKNAITSGWGTTSEGGSSATNLQAVTVQMVSNADCNVAYGAGRVTDRMCCAGVNGGGKDACQGDSGGPLVVDGELIGIVSWGRGCARPDYPGVYGSVTNMREYITEVSGL